MIFTKWVICFTNKKKLKVRKICHPLPCLIPSINYLMIFKVIKYNLYHLKYLSCFVHMNSVDRWRVPFESVGGGKKTHSPAHVWSLRPVKLILDYPHMNYNSFRFHSPVERKYHCWGSVIGLARILWCVSDPLSFSIVFIYIYCSWSYTVVTHWFCKSSVVRHKNGNYIFSLWYDVVSGIGEFIMEQLCVFVFLFI